jgi:hypothetical protein
MEITFAIGYRRRRAHLTNAWEARFATIGLIVGGILVTLVFLLGVLRLPLPF